MAEFYRMTEEEVRIRNEEEVGLARDLADRKRKTSGGGKPGENLPGIQAKAAARWYANKKKDPEGGANRNGRKKLTTGQKNETQG